jgi:hypothetical protein
MIQKYETDVTNALNNLLYTNEQMEHELVPDERALPGIELARDPLAKPLTPTLRPALAEDFLLPQLLHLNSFRSPTHPRSAHVDSMFRYQAARLRNQGKRLEK